MQQAEPFEVLLALARDPAVESRRLLFEEITDMVLSPDRKLTDRERALMKEILGKLLHEVDVEVRQQMAERMAQSEIAPRDLICMLAMDEIQVARPVLQWSRVLQDPDLIDVIRLRGQEHRLMVAMREGLSEAVSQALIDFGDDQVVEALIANHDAALSQDALNYLVEESKTVDRFQEPLLRRPDLSAALAHRMFWWVAGGLREGILTNYAVDEIQFDKMIAEIARSAVVNAGDSPAERLAQRMADRGELTERFIIQNLRLGHVAAAMAGLAKLSHLDLATTRRIMLDSGGQALAACCKAAGFSRGGFATVFLLSREAHDRSRVDRPNTIEIMLKLFDRLTLPQCRQALSYWASDADYLDNVVELRPGMRPGVRPPSLGSSASPVA